MKRIAYLIFSFGALFCISCEKVEEASETHVVEKYHNSSTETKGFNISLDEGDIAGTYILAINQWYDEYNLTKGFSIKSSYSWKITNIPSWLTVTPTEGGPSVEYQGIVCETQENTTGVPRFGTMYLEVNGKRLTIDVIHEGIAFKSDEPFEGVNISELNHSYGYRYNCFFNWWGDTHYVNLTSTHDWEFTSIPQWVTVEPKSGIGSNSRVYIAMTATTNEATRRKEVAKLKLGDYTLEIVLEQPGSKDLTY